MDRKLLLQRLRDAKERVELGREHLARQGQIVAQLQREGHDTKLALEVLALFELSQQKHVADQLRIEQDLRWERGMKRLQKMGWDG